MFVAPLLTLLANILAHHHYTIVAQSANDGLRDAATRSQLTDARLVTDGVDDVGRCRCAQYLWRDDAYGSRRVLQLCIARYARHCHFVQIQMAEEYVGRILRMVMCLIVVLCCHCRAYTQQRQNDISCFHSVI